MDMELVKKGRREPRNGLVQQVGVSVALAKDERYVAQLALYGFPPERTAELERVEGILASELAEQAEAKDGSKLSTVAQNEALSEAKQFKRRLDRAVRSVFRMEKDLPVTRDAFAVNGSIDDSVPKMVAWLLVARPAVVAIAEPLKKRLGGIDPVATLDARRAALEAADVTQERNVQDLPGDTLAVYEAKGRALLLIEELNDAGRNAFDDDAHVAGQFNKDVLVRARKTRKVKVPKVA